MTAEHRTLAAGRWLTLSFAEQMANIGGEVERALNWSERGNCDYSTRAYWRALELLDMTVDDPANRRRLRELTRTREALVDFFDGCNEYKSSPSIWRNYFGAFAYLARRDR